jgi:hypothetical protein
VEEEGMQRDERMKASDLYKAGGPVFGERGPLDVIFPTIDEIRVEVNESGAGVRDFDRLRVFTRKEDVPEYVDCSNSLCYAGGVSVGAVIRELVRTGGTEAAVGNICRGHEGSPKGRRIYQKCVNHFKTKVTIRYKS